MSFQESQIVIIGAGLAGLTAAIHLQLAGKSVLLIEKQTFPKHKVCGEYVSNEVLPYLERLGVFPLNEGAKNIQRFEFSTATGKRVMVKLPLGGFGISRYALDTLLLERAKSLGVEVLKDQVNEVHFNNDIFSVHTNTKVFTSKWVVGAFGKRSNLDVSLSRNFIQNKSPWLAVKAHYNADFEDDLVGLHNFKGGYCGLSKVETNAVNVCYLTNYSSFKKYKNIETFENEVVRENSVLKEFFETAEMSFEKRLSISQISFQTKLPVEQHVFMLGDSAGLIHPLCGTGMAMAMHSAQIFSTLFLMHENQERGMLERAYKKKWQQQFRRRMYVGSLIQRALQNNSLTGIGLTVLQKSPRLLKSLIKSTHGKPI